MLGFLGERRQQIGRVTFFAACVFFCLALFGDVLLFASNSDAKISAFLSRYPSLLADLLVGALVGCFFTGLLAFFAEGRRRAFGLAISFGTFLLCTPLGAGY
jgi:Na+/phosphate symporter